MQISAINNFRNRTSFGNSENSKENAQNVDNYKKDFLQKHYNEQYKKDLKNYNIGSVIGLIMGLTFLVEELVRKNKIGAIIAGITLAACTPLHFIFKPKKEKYDGKIQIELNNSTQNISEQVKKD